VTAAAGEVGKRARNFSSWAFMMCLADCAPARIRILPAVAIGLICEAMRAFPAQNLSIGDNGAAARARLSPLFAAAGLALALLLAATAALWAHYAVFYETMAAALAACL
jgi:hypothetical protein